MYIEGINPLLSYTISLEVQMPFRVGQRGKDQAGREFVFCNSLLAVALGDVLVLPITATVVTPLTTAVAINLYNRQVGVSQVAFGAVATTGTGFWAQVQGATLPTGGIRASASANANATTYTTVTSSALSTLVTASYLVRGLTFTAAPSGAGVFAGFLNYPTVGLLIADDL